MAADGLPAKLEPARKLYRGAHRTWTHVFHTDAAKTELRDLTGHTFRAQFREDKNRGAVVCESVCTVIGDGTVLEVLMSDEADKLPGEVEGAGVPKVFWDLESIDADGERHTWLYSDCTVKGDRSHG